jgi:hypothetical protein
MHGGPTTPSDFVLCLFVGEEERNESGTKARGMEWYGLGSSEL